MELQEVIRIHLERAEDHRPDAHKSHLMYCDQETFEKLDNETELKKALMKNEVEVREVRDDLRVEALKCFGRHGRPEKGCPDWCDESKTIGRKIGVPPEKRQYLCMYCPVGSYVAYQERKAMGMYDSKS